MTRMPTSWHHSRPRKFVRDFHRQRYGNPLFPNAGSRAVRRNGRRGGRAPIAFPVRGIAVAVLGIAVAAAFWYAFWGPALRVDAFDVQGVSGPTEDAIRGALAAYASQRSLLVFPRNGILVFNEGAAKKAVQQAVFLDDVDIRKKLPNTIVVTAHEKTLKAVSERDGRFYALDESGFVIRELSGKELSQMGDLPPGLTAVQVQGLGAESVDVPQAAAAPAAPAQQKTPDAQKKEPPKAPAADVAANDAPKNAWPLIVDQRPDDPHRDVRSPGSQSFSAQTVGLVLQAQGRLPDVAGEAVRWFIPDETSDSVDALMAGGWHVFLATGTPFDVQAERLSLVLKDKVGNRRPSLEYVDLRYNERIFFRLKDAAQ